MVGFSDEFVHR